MKKIKQVQPCAVTMLKKLTRIMQLEVILLQNDGSNEQAQIQQFSMSGKLKTAL